MLTDFCTNPVLFSVVILLILSALRLNVVFSLVIARSAEECSRE